MASRQRPEMIGFRVTMGERREIEAVAAHEGDNLASLCRAIILDEVRRRLRALLAESEIGR